MYKMISGIYFFFFKQKTAYEMRISDWSSDVCSSDLLHQYLQSFRAGGRGPGSEEGKRKGHEAQAVGKDVACSGFAGGDRLPCQSWLAGASGCYRLQPGRLWLHHLHRQQRPIRSEEHTSELQSLMRISYAVFCLKKKK